MKQILAVFRQFFRGELRDKYSLFWNLAFPLILMVILVLVLEHLEGGRRHAVVVIPDSFDNKVHEGIMNQYSPLPESMEAGEVLVYSRSGNQMSSIVVDVLTQIITNVNKEVNIGAGLEAEGLTVDFKEFQVEPTAEPGRGFHFADYLLPGIIIMAFMMSGLGVMVERLTLYRERGILKRYFATPLRSSQYSLGLLLHVMILSLTQVAIIYVFGVYVFDVNIPLFSPWPLFYLIFSLITLLSLGLLIAGVCKTANAANTFTKVGHSSWSLDRELSVQKTKNTTLLLKVLHKRLFMR